VTQPFNEQAMLRHISTETGVDEKIVAVVLKHEKAFIDKAQANAKGEVDIDSDELVDYVLSRPDVKLTEIVVEEILDTEMDYLMEQGLAGYVD